MKSRSLIIKVLLGILNSRWLNKTPCRYGHIGNVDAFELSNLECEERMRPGITVAQIIKEAYEFKSCPIRPGLTVLEDGTPREANVWDLHELNQSLTRKVEQQDGN